MKSSVKSETGFRLFYYNIEFLFSLNKKKNNRKKIDFFRETNISQQSLTKWKQGSLPARTTLNRIVIYFNKWLNLELRPDDLLTKDLHKTFEIEKINEQQNYYLNTIEKKLLENFRKLNKEDQELIIKLIKRINHGP